MTAPKTPLISVIIPFFNVAPFLAEAIDSVISQSFSDWELLLADDGSTDGSSEIAQHYAREQPGRIRYLHHRSKANKGAAATRNLGLQAAKGTYLALLDSDDKWMNHKLETQVAVALQHPEVDLVCGASVFWESWSGKKDADKVEPVHYPELTQSFLARHPELSATQVVSPGIADGDVIIHPPFAAILLYPLGDQSAPCPCSLLVKKETVVKAGGFVEAFKGRYAFYEDQAFLIKLYLNSSVYVAKEALDYYRLRPGSVMSEASGKRNYRMARYFFISWFARYLKHHDFHHPMLQYNLEAARWKLHYPRRERLKDNLYTLFRSAGRRITGAKK